MSYRNLQTPNKKEFLDLNIHNLTLSGSSIVPSISTNNITGNSGDLTIGTDFGNVIINASSGDVLIENLIIDGAELSTDVIHEKTPLSRVSFPDGLKTNDIVGISGDLLIENVGDIVINSTGSDVKIEDLTANGIGLKVDEIREITPANSVSFIDNLKTNIITERTGNTGVTIDGLLVKDSAITLLTSGGTPTPLDFYEEAILSFDWDLAGDVFISSVATNSTSITKIGNVCVMTVEQLTQTTKGSGVLTAFDSTAIPTRFRPLFDIEIPITGVDGGVDVNSPYRCVILMTGVIRVFHRYSGNWPTSEPSAGFQDWCASWTIS